MDILDKAIDKLPCSVNDNVLRRSRCGRRKISTDINNNALSVEASTWIQSVVYFFSENCMSGIVGEILTSNLHRNY